MLTRIRGWGFRIVVTSVVTMNGGCSDSPSIPSRIPTTPQADGAAPSPTPGSVPVPPGASETFHLSGLVSDDKGVGVPGAKVTVLLDGYSGPYVTTDMTGRYEISFDGVPGQLHVPGRDPAGTETALAFGQVESPGYERFAMYILGTTNNLVADVRLHPVRRITAGESVQLAVAPEDTVCGVDYWPGREFVCGIVRVVAPTDGTLTVDATAMPAGSPTPRLILYGGNTGTESNPATLRVLAGTEYTVNAQLPWGGSVSQSVVVTTTMTR